MDLDVKMKAVMLGACFLIVRIAQDGVCVRVCLFSLTVGFYVLWTKTEQQQQAVLN